MQKSPCALARQTLSDTLLSSLSRSEKFLHDHALDLSRRHRALEAELVAILVEIDESKLFRRLGWSSLFSYAVSALGLSEAAAYAFITVARKTKQVEHLGAAIESRRISVAKASRLTGILTRENAGHLIEFAVTHTIREVDNEVGRLRALAESSAGAARAKRQKLEISGAVLDLIKRAEACVASRERKPVDLDRVLTLVLNDYLERVDPVRKAQRAQKRSETAVRTKNSVQTELPAKSKTEPRSAAPAGSPTEPASATTVTPTSGPTSGPTSATRTPFKLPTTPTRVSRTTGSHGGRKPLTAKQKHTVFARDGGRCTFQDLTGNRCLNQSWLHLHHIHPVSLGGGNESSNLTTLCAFHHELVHQLSLPIEGQVSWTRERQAAYR